MTHTGLEDTDWDDLATAAAAARARDAAAAGRPKRVGFYPRLGAAALDGICLFVPVAGFAAIEDYLASAGRLTEASAYLLNVAAHVLFVIYTSLEVVLAATPGKLILGQRIAHADGTVADAWTRANRWLYKNGGILLGLVAAVTAAPLVEWLSSLWTSIVLLGCFFVFQDTRQAFHDRWARTAVYPRRAVTRRGFEPIPLGVPAPPW